MKLKSRLMMFTAAAALSANMAFAAPVDPQALADAYLAEGYTYVEIKTGPTQTKLEAVKGDRKVEVIYDNATGDVIKQEFENADDDYIGRTGVEIEDSSDDFEDDDSDDSDDDEGDDEGDDDEGDDDEGDDDEGDDDESDDDEDDDDESDDDEDDDDESDGDDDSDDDEDDSEGGNDGDESDND